MKILFILNLDFGLPGPSIHILEDIMEGLLRDSNELTVITKDLGKGENHCPPNLARLKKLNIIPVKARFEKGNWLKRFYFDAKYAIECSKLYKKMCPDTVFLQSCNTAYFHVKYLKKYLKTRIIFNVQDIFPYNAKFAGNLPASGISFPILGSMQRYAYRRVDEIITISEDMACLLRNDNIRNTPVSVIHNWGYQDTCEVIEDSRNLFLQNYSFGADVLRVVYAGNIGMVQNVELIIKAAIKLKNEEKIKFYFIGDGSNSRHLQETAKEENLTNVYFYPMQDENMAPYIYSMADVNMIPLSKGIIRTALPSKTAACLSSCRCVVGCIEKDSELGSLLNETDGCYVVSNEDENELVQTLLKLSQMPLRQEHTARESAMSVFSKGNNVKKYVDKLERHV